jgi:hypothetical protein
MKKETIYFEKELTVGELLKMAEMLKQIYLCVSGFQRSMDIADNVIDKLDKVLKTSGEKVKAMEKGGAKDIEKVTSEVVKVKLAKITRAELEEGVNLKILRVNPLFLHSYKYLIE